MAVYGENPHQKGSRDSPSVPRDGFVVPGSGEGRRESPSKLKRLFEYLRDLKEAGFTGYIKINYSQGQIGRVEKFEEILKE